MLKELPHKYRIEVNFEDLAQHINEKEVLLINTEITV